MTTYICKCGRTFQKNTEAGTTGFRMPDYGPEHECFGCPFVCKVMTWDPGTQQNAVQNHECRGSKELQYETQAVLSLGDKCVGRIYGLDLNFLHQVRAFADSLDGINPDRYAFSDRPADYCDDGRFKLTIYPAQNNKGIAAKQTLFEKFFNPDGSRKDVTSEQEKEIVLNQIKEAKALAQGKTAPTWTAYVHGNFRYFADQRDDNGKFTAFMSSPSLGEGVRSEVPTIPDFDTFDEAQNALDGFALKKGYAAEGSTPEEKLEMKQPGFGPDGMEELAEYQELTHQNGNEVPDSGNDVDENDPPKNESQVCPQDSGDSTNDIPEEPQEPCDWKNASGADDDDDEDEEPEKPDQSLPDGPDLSLRLPAFDAIFNAADDALRDMARTLKTKFIESGELDLKIVIDNMGGILRPNCKSSKGYCQLKPAKVTFPIRFSDDVEFTVDAQGRVILPEDREHQINFDEIQPGRNIPPTGTATVDGNTGIVEDYKEDGDGDQTPEVGQSGEVEEKLYPCTNCDCPFFGVSDDGDEVCCFDPGADDIHQPDVVSDLDDAIKFENCTRPEVIEAYSAACPAEETDF